MFRTDITIRSGVFLNILYVRAEIGLFWVSLQTHIFLFFMNFLIDYEIKNYISEKRIQNWTGLPFQKFQNISQGGNTKIGLEFRDDPIHTGSFSVRISFSQLF